MIKVVFNYCLMLGLYLLMPLIGWVYIILTFIYLFKKDKKQIKYFLISLLLFLFSFYLIINPINETTYYYGLVTKTSDNYFILFCNGNNYYIYEKDNLKEVGDIIKLTGDIYELSFNKYEGDFDFKNYLNNINVFYELEYESINTIFYNPFRINEIKRFFLSFYNEEVKEFLKMYVFSSSSSYSNKVSKIGLYTILSSSGLLVYILIDVLKKIIFRFINNKKRIYIPYIIIIPLIFFVDFKIGIIRAILISLNKDLLNKKYSRNYIYSFTLLISLLLNPYYFKTSSFIYSFVLPYAIGFLKEATKSFKNIYRDLIFTIIIQFLFLPITIYYNDLFSFISIFIMLLFKDIFGLLFSFIYILVLFPFLNIITNYVCNFMIFVINLLEKISISLNYDISLLFVIIYYVIFIITILLFERKALKKGYISFGVMISFILLSSSNINTYFLSYISFIDVGQGDAILIHDKTYDILIDTGGSMYKDIALDVLIPYFNKKGIKDLDYVFLSHDDYDHNGAFELLSSNFLVKKYVLGSNFNCIEVGDLKFKNLNHYGDNSLSNDDSSVIKLDFYSTKYLFTGDISTDIENKLIKYEDVVADVLKVAHHGSKTSSSINFLKKVNPKIAVISVGENNYYHHPSEVVINRLANLNIKTYRTDINGTITFTKYIKKYY